MDQEPLYTESDTTFFFREFTERGITSASSSFNFDDIKFNFDTTDKFTQEWGDVSIEYSQERGQVEIQLKRRSVAYQNAANSNPVPISEIISVESTIILQNGKIDNAQIRVSGLESGNTVLRSWNASEQPSTDPALIKDLKNDIYRELRIAIDKYRNSRKF